MEFIVWQSVWIGLVGVIVFVAIVWFSYNRKKNVRTSSIRRASDISTSSTSSSLSTNCTTDGQSNNNNNNNNNNSSDEREEMEWKLLESVRGRKGEEVKKALELLCSTYPTFTIDTPLGERGNTALVYACHVSNKEMVKLLLDFGADVNSTDALGNSGIHWATRMGKGENLKLMLQYKANIRKRNNDQMLAIHWAAMNGRDAIVEILFNYGSTALINEVDSAGRTTLHYAAWNGHDSTLKMLIDKGGDLNIQDKELETPLHKAAHNGSRNCIALLIQSGAKILPNHKGHSPMHTAVLKGIQNKPGVMSMLQCHKAFLADITEMMTWDNLDSLNTSTPATSSTSTASSSSLPLSSQLTAIIEHVASFPEYFGSLISSQLTKNCVTTGLEIISFWKKETTPLPSEKCNAFLRLVRCISSLLATRYGNSDLNNYKKEEESIREVEIMFNKLWNALDDHLCMAKEIKMGNNNNNNHNEIISSLSTTQVQVITCLVEGFAIYFKSNYGTDEPHKELVNFVEKHFALIHSMIQNNPDLLVGAFDFIMMHPKLSSRFPMARSIPFDKKQNWLKEKIFQERAKKNFQGASITVVREHLFQNSCGLLLSEDIGKLKGEINVRFEGEIGVGAGVRREWFKVLSDEMFNADYALFNLTSSNTFQPNPRSYINPDHLSYFQFVGRIIGMAIYHQELLDVHFTRSFYKHILGIKISVEDMESIDPEYYKNLKWILDNSIEDLDLTFSSEMDMFGTNEVVDLIANGRNVPVTDENKQEYVQLVTELKMTKAIQQQIDYFLKGFFEMIPRSLICIFNEFELELLISGLPTIDPQDWKDHCAYTTGYTESSPQVQWFWELVFQMNQEERANLLQFTTGNSKVPIGGFKNLKGLHGLQSFTLSRVPYTEQLPTASTCFNMMKLPEYPSFDILKRNILVAIKCGREGFLIN